MIFTSNVAVRHKGALQVVCLLHCSQKERRKDSGLVHAAVLVISVFHTPISIQLMLYGDNNE